MRTKESESGRRRFFAWGASPPLSDLGTFFSQRKQHQKNKDERIIIMKTLIRPKTDIMGSRQPASLTGLLLMPLAFSLIFLGLCSAIACDETCDDSLNTGFGNGTLVSNTTGYCNAAFGQAALIDNTTGSYNVAFGCSALDANTTGNNNTVVGFESLTYDADGIANTAMGSLCMKWFVGSHNTGVCENVMVGDGV